MAGLDPRPRERGVVNQPHVGEPAQDRVGHFVGDAALLQGLGELRPGAGREREQPQARLPCPRLRVVVLRPGLLQLGGFAFIGPGVRPPAACPSRGPLTGGRVLTHCVPLLGRLR